MKVNFYSILIYSTVCSKNVYNRTAGPAKSNYPSRGSAKIKFVQQNINIQSVEMICTRHIQANRTKGHRIH